MVREHVLIGSAANETTFWKRIWEGGLVLKGDLGAEKSFRNRVELRQQNQRQTTKPKKEKTRKQRKPIAYSIL
jgi:hypothetical protein